MPFAENGLPLDDDTRRRLNEIMGLVAPAPAEQEALGRKAADLRKQLESEAEVIDGEIQEVTRADILRRACTEKFV